MVSRERQTHVKMGNWYVFFCQVTYNWSNSYPGWPIDKNRNIITLTQLSCFPYFNFKEWFFPIGIYSPSPRITDWKKENCFYQAEPYTSDFLVQSHPWGRDNHIRNTTQNCHIEKPMVCGSIAPTRPPLSIQNTTCSFWRATSWIIWS